MYKQGNNLLRKVWPLFIVAMIALLAVSGYSALNLKSTVSAVTSDLVLDFSMLGTTYDTAFAVQITDENGLIVFSNAYSIENGTRPSNDTVSDLTIDANYTLTLLAPSFANDIALRYTSTSSATGTWLYTTNYKFTMLDGATFGVRFSIVQDSWFSDTTVV